MGADELAVDPVEAAHRLLGATLTGRDVTATIVEVEAYGGVPDGPWPDPAAHSYRGPTGRNTVMFGPPGRAYIYLSYGIHWCLNFVCREAGHGAGVLIRALEPTAGVSTMINRRRQQDLRMLCAGPGRLGQALAVTRELNGKCIDVAPFSLTAASTRGRVVCGPRIGISKAVERPWRFGLAGSRYLSRPFR